MGNGLNLSGVTYTKWPLCHSVVDVAWGAVVKAYRISVKRYPPINTYAHDYSIPMIDARIKLDRLGVVE